MRRFIAFLFLALALACGGSSSSAPQAPTPAPAPPPPTPTPEMPSLKVYRSKAQALTVGAPVGAEFSPLLVMETGGAFRLEMSGWAQIRGNLGIRLDWSLYCSADTMLIRQDGSMELTTVTGTMHPDGSITLTTALGTVDVAPLPAPGTPQTVAMKAGVYLTTASSTGLWYRATFAADGSIVGKAYATQEDQLAGDESKALGTLTASLHLSPWDPDGTKNVWIFGTSYYVTGNSTPTGTDGLATFDGTDLLVICAHSYNPAAGQLSARWVKLP